MKHQTPANAFHIFISLFVCFDPAVVTGQTWLTSILSPEKLPGLSFRPWDCQYEEMRFKFVWIAGDLAGFMQQSIDNARQSAQEFSAIQRLNQGLLRLHLNLGRELVKAPSVMRGQITLEASKAESVIASGAYPVFRLPKAAAVDTEAGTRSMMR